LPLFATPAALLLMPCLLLTTVQRRRAEQSCREGAYEADAMRRERAMRWISLAAAMFTLTSSPAASLSPISPLAAYASPSPTMMPERHAAALRATFHAMPRHARATPSTFSSH